MPAIDIVKPLNIAFCCFSGLTGLDLTYVGVVDLVRDEVDVADDLVVFEDVLLLVLEEEVDVLRELLTVAAFE